MRTTQPSSFEDGAPDGNAPDQVDAELLRKSRAGDGRAFHALVDRHADRLYRLAVSLVGNAADAEDVLQEAFAGAYKAAAAFENRSSVKTWLTRILATQAAKWRRDRQRRPAGTIEGAEPVSSAPSAADAAGERIDLHAALQQLSPEHREVLVLREFEGLSYEEMAAALNVPRGTIESRLYRARADLKDKLRSYLP